MSQLTFDIARTLSSSSLPTCLVQTHHIEAFQSHQAEEGKYLIELACILGHADAD